MPDELQPPKIETPEGQPVSPEVPASLEQKSSPEKKSGADENAVPVAAPAPAAAPVEPAPPADPYRKKLEHLLEDDLKDVYKTMPPDARKRFREKGEVTIRSILTMMRSAHIQIKKVLGLIADWLKIIPGVSAFFIEKEAKIKAEAIMKLAEEQRLEKEQGKSL